MSDFFDVLTAAHSSNTSTPGLLHSLTTAAASAGAGSSRLTGLAQLAVLALLAFPIWLFGLLIGLLLPKDTFVVFESQAAEDAGDVSSSTSSRASDTPGISSRPLSDEDITDSESSQCGEDDGHSSDADAVAPRSTAKNDTTHSSLDSIAVRPASSLGAAGKMMSVAAGKASHSVAWAQHLVGQQHQAHKYVSPSGPSTPDASYTSRVAIKSPEHHTMGQSHSQQCRHGHKHHRHPQQLVDPVRASNPLSDQQAAFAAGSDRALRHFGSGSSGRRSLSGPQAGPHWFVTDDDLDKFVETVQPLEDKLLTGNIGPEWSLIMDKEVAGVVRYVSYWRPTDNGTTDYLSVTIIPDATAQEIHEFNLDDACRASWDPMLNQTWLLSSKDTSAAEQLVVWLRSFPMGFLSDRLYSGIARRTFPDTQRPGSSVYGVTKLVKTPASAAWAAEHHPGVIQTDNYFSAWRCRTVPSPWEEEAPSLGGSSNCSNGMPQLTIKTTQGGQSAGDIGGSRKPACELILLHHDELKVPEYLSRLAIKVGMWKFVTGMVDAAGAWLEQRRTRCDPFRDDPQAACRKPAPPLAGAAAAAVAAATVPESPFSPLARRMPQPDAHPSAASDSVDADVLLSPRRLYAVPTAPDLTLLSVPVEGQEDSRERGAVPAAAAAAAPGIFYEGDLARKSGGLRRGHSLEWDPKTDDATTGAHGTGGSTAAMNRRFMAGEQDSDVLAAEHATKQQQQQQQHRHRLNVGPVQLSLQPLRAIVGAVPAAVQSATSRLPAALRDMIKGLRRTDLTTAESTPMVKEPAQSQPGPGISIGLKDCDRAKACQDVGDVGGSDTPGRDGSDVSKSWGRDQHKQATYQQAGEQLPNLKSERRSGSSRPGKVENVHRFVVGVFLVYAASGIIKLLAGSGQEEVQKVSTNSRKGKR